MTRPPIIQYDAEVIRAAVTALHTYLPGIIAAVNVELAAEGDTLTLTYPGDGSIQAREEGNLAERILPQFNAGVWIRIVDIEDNEILGVALGETRTTHTMEVISWVNVQDDLPDSTVGSASSGYIQAMYFSRAVDDVLRSRLGSTAACTAGIYGINRIPGARIPSPLQRLPSVHTIRNHYEVMQRTLSPYPPGSPVPEDALSHGSFSLGAAAGTTLTAVGTWTKVASGTTAGSVVDFSHTDGRLTYSGATTKPMQAIASISGAFVSASTTLTFRIAVNGITVAASETGTSYSVPSARENWTVVLPTQDFSTSDYVEVFADTTVDGTFTPATYTLTIIETVDT